MRTRRGVALVAVVSATLALGACSRRTVGPLEATSESALTDRLDKVVAATYANDGPGAAVLVAKGGHIVLRKGYGLASVELRVPIEPDMIFRVGSVTKQFTAALILLLAEDGRLRLDDDVRKYVPDFPAGERRVTIEHLLTHTSGIKNYTELPSWRNVQTHDLLLPELIALFRNEPFDFEPGTRYHYSNSGYVLLGAIIESLSGRSYGDALRERILEPLGMTHTFYGATAPIIPRRVQGYVRDGLLLNNAPYLSMTQPHAAGALVSSVDDLLTWDRALTEGRILGADARQKWITPYRLSNGRVTHYGYGWSVNTYEGHPVIEHSGGIHGFRGHVLRLPADLGYIAVLSNDGGPGRSPTTLARRLAAIVMDRPLPAPDAAALDPATQLAALVGSYAGSDELGDPFVQQVTLDGERLVTVRDEGPTTPLVPLSPTEFALEDSTARVSFVLDGSGRATGLRLRDWGRDEVAKRQP